jgi:DNA repair protein RadC
MKYDIISTRKYRKTISIKHPDDLYNFLKRYARNKQELFLVITLNGAHEVINIHISTIGLVNKTIVHPREVFIHAIKDNATSTVVAHNHLSGSIKPSTEDEEITKRLKESAEILGFNFLDHLIIGKYTYFSFKQNDLILKRI